MSDDRSPRNIRFHEIPTFAWITACAFTPECLPLWSRYILALLAWPTAVLFPLAVGIKSIYRTDDFSGVAIMNRKEGTHFRMAIRCAALFLVAFGIASLPLFLDVPAWVFGLYPHAFLAVLIALGWVLLGAVILLGSARLASREEEGPSKLAPRGTPKVETDGPVFAISGVAKRLGNGSGMGVAFRLVQSLIKSLPEGNYVVIQPRTGSLREAYAKRGFKPSGRRDMVLRVPSTDPAGHSGSRAAHEECVVLRDERDGDDLHDLVNEPEDALERRAHGTLGSGNGERGAPDDSDEQGYDEDPCNEHGSKGQEQCG